jgi:hypothetical protein
MDLESVQEKLFERKLDLIEYFKAAFDIYKEFLKNNKLLVFSTCLLLMLITSLDILNKYLMALVVKHREVKIAFLVMILLILELILSVGHSFLIGYYFKKIVMGIEGTENSFEFKKFFLKMLKFIGIQYCLVTFFLVVSLELNLLHLNFIDLVLKIVLIVMFFKYFLYFETYYVRDFKIMDSIEYSHQLSKANRLRKIIPEVIFILISIVFVFIIFLGISKIFGINYQIEIITTVISIIGFVFWAIYFQVLSISIFLNVEYDYLKNQEEKNINSDSNLDMESETIDCKNEENDN